MKGLGFQASRCHQPVKNRNISGMRVQLNPSKTYRTLTTPNIHPSVNVLYTKRVWILTENLKRGSVNIYLVLKFIANANNRFVWTVRILFQINSY